MYLINLFKPLIIRMNAIFKLQIEQKYLNYNQCGQINAIWWKENYL